MLMDVQGKLILINNKYPNALVSSETSKSIETTDKNLVKKDFK